MMAITRAKSARTAALIKRLFSDRHGSEGATAVEFALITPIFLVFVYGLLEFGRVLFTMAVLFFAAEEASRYSIVNYTATTTEIRQVAESKFLMIDPAKIITFDVTSVLNVVDQTKLVTIDIVYSFEPLVSIVWSTITLRGHSRGFIVDK